MIEVKNIYRWYESKKGFIKREKVLKNAVNGISFNVPQGQIFGLIGPNGAGKTTTIKMMTTLLTPSKGSISIFGLDITKSYKEIQKRINFIYGGERSLYWRLSARDNLIYFADLYSVPKELMKNRIEELIVLVGLEKVADNKVETYSKGMKQRLQIARALINNPDIIFMDEPTIGLDPTATMLLHDIILDLKGQGKTIILTTHYMAEAESLCDQIAFINDGKILDIDSPINHIKKNNVKTLQDVYISHFKDKKSVS